MVMSIRDCVKELWFSGRALPGYRPERASSSTNSHKADKACGAS